MHYTYSRHISQKFNHVWKRRTLIPSGRITWGPEGPGPPERPGGPRETSGLRGYKGACKKTSMKSPINPWLQHIILITNVDAFFAAWNVTSWGLAKNFLGSLSLPIFCSPLINFAIVRPVLIPLGPRRYTSFHDQPWVNLPALLAAGFLNHCNERSVWRHVLR